MTEPRISCSVYALGAGAAWVAGFALILIGWAVHTIYVSLLGIGLVGVAAAVTVSICTWRVSRNLGRAFEYGRDVERERVRRVH